MHLSGPYPGLLGSKSKGSNTQTGIEYPQQIVILTNSPIFSVNAALKTVSKNKNHKEGNGIPEIEYTFKVWCTIEPRKPNFMSRMRGKDLNGSGDLRGQMSAMQ